MIMAPGSDPAVPFTFRVNEQIGWHFHTSVSSSLSGIMMVINSSAFSEGKMMASKYGS